MLVTKYKNGRVVQIFWARALNLKKYEPKVIERKRGERRLEVGGESGERRAKSGEETEKAEKKDVR